VAVGLDGFVAADGPEIAAIAAAPSVGRVEPVVRVGARLRAPGAEELDVLLEVVDLRSDVWSPSLVDGSLGDRTGLVVSQKAADDLGVKPGDTVELQHPMLTSEGVVLVRTALPVAGIHAGAFRFNAYLDQAQLAAFGAGGVANALYVLPSAGSDSDAVKRDLFPLDGVASVQPISAATKILKDSLSAFTSVFRVLELFILGLALLIAYNATSINADERARERATLFAFGLPVRRVIALETVEGLIHGVIGTAVGLVVGLGVVHWVTTSILSSTMPDMTLDVIVSPGTVLAAAALGTAAVAIAPLLTIRRLRHMDVPGTLRIVE
jgi:putative ABC transport system permease protein